ncbi:MAG: hypothetical protein H7X86_06520, partial [Gorillibacterium sp.]|nr:hypothetical protein [Gorillibacterium sp.]
MGRFLLRMVWVALLIFLGVQIGVHQAEKRQNIVAQDDNYTNGHSGSKSFVSRVIQVSGIGNGSAIKGTGTNSNVKGMAYTGATVAGSAEGSRGDEGSRIAEGGKGSRTHEGAEGSRTAAGAESSRAIEGAEAAGSSGTTSNPLAGETEYMGEERSAESFLNRLG